MPAQPLVIEDADVADVRVLASPLELQNKKTVSDALDFNVRLKAQKERDSGKRLRARAELGADYIVRSRNSTRTMTLPKDL